MKASTLIATAVSVALWTTFVFWTGHYMGKWAADKWWQQNQTAVPTILSLEERAEQAAKEGASPVFVFGRPLYYWHDYAFVCSVDKLVVGNVYLSSNGWGVNVGTTLHPEFDTRNAAMSYVERETKFICERGGAK